MSSLTIWLLQTGEPVHTDAGNPRPMRAINLADSLSSRGHKVVIWTSAFFHQEKRHRFLHYSVIDFSDKIQIRFIPSPGYTSNIGLGRLWDHFHLARNLRRALSSESQRPDVAFIGYPPIESSWVMVRWLRMFGVPTLLDLKDQWPSLFLDAVPAFFRPISKLILFPYFWLAKRTMK